MGEVVHYKQDALKSLFTGLQVEEIDGQLLKCVSGLYRFKWGYHLSLWLFLRDALTFLGDEMFNIDIIL